MGRSEEAICECWGLGRLRSCYIVREGEAVQGETDRLELCSVRRQGGMLDATQSLSEFTQASGSMSTAGGYLSCVRIQLTDPAENPNAHGVLVTYL